MRTPGIPVDLVRRNVEMEPLEKQELQRLTEGWKIKALIKQDEIPRMNRPGTSKGYYLFIEDDSGCMVEQRDEQGNIQMIKDTDTDRRLPTDLITEEEAETYQIPERDQLTSEDDVETISSTSMANYDREEVETSLTNITEAFHMIAQEYEKLTGMVPHMSKVQAAQVIARIPILPSLKQEMKEEKATESTEPIPGTSQELVTATRRQTDTPSPEEAMAEQITEEKEDEPEVEVTDDYLL